MTSDAADPGAGPPNIWQLHVEQRGTEWALCSGSPPAQVHVVSLHATRELAEAALRVHNASADRGTSNAGG